MYKKYLIIGQDISIIQLIEKMYGLNIKPEQISLIISQDNLNVILIEYIKYYNINYLISNKSNFNGRLNNILKEGIDLVISFTNPFIIEDKLLNKSIFINFHPGILPKYRGSFSTVWSLINGESKVGGAWHYIIPEVDMGNILKLTEINIKDNDTAFSLNHKIFSNGINDLELVLSRVDTIVFGIKQEKNRGKFYLHKFPDLDKLNLTDELKYKINYFPPKYI